MTTLNSYLGQYSCIAIRLAKGSKIVLMTRYYFHEDSPL